MKYVCLVYFDPKKVFDGSEEGNAILADAGPHARELMESGRLVATQALTLPSEAMTVRVRDGETSITDGPFMETREMLGGFTIIEAADMNEALEIASGDPFARAGAIEVRPVVDFSKSRPRM